ncbi:MAG TPA: DUF1592 domain-containing protein [Bdellovibrionales bacterium]|nr:DUF1592 domain-containing protein [Bdellovibrionales bacterium]
MKKAILLTALLCSACSKGNLAFQDGEGSLASSGGLCVDPSSNGSPTPIRRLSKRELSNTFRDLLGTTIAQGLADALAVIPNDEKGIKFDHVSNTTNLGHVEGLFGLAESAANAIITSNPSYMAISSCLASTADTTCMSRFIMNFGYKAFRRPLTAEENGLYNSVYASLRITSKQEAAKVVIAAILQSPKFYYIVETEGTPAGGTALTLTPYEVATRLSYALTGSMPDDTLLAAAASGELDSDAGLTKQAERLIASASGRNHFKEYINQYLRLDMIPQLNYSAAFLAGQSLTNLNSQIVQEAQDYMALHMLDRPSTFAELMTSRTSIVKDAALARLYGIAVPSSPTGEATLPPERAGMLTRAAVLVSGNDAHNPFHRGQVIATDFLCAPIGRPDPDAVPDAFKTVENVADITTRAHLEGLTSGKTCQGCHQTLNNFGFALENFDALGRFRTMELKFDQSGQVVKSLPIDANTTPTIDGRQVGVSGSGDLSQMLSTSKQAQHCFTRKWMRFALAKFENTAADGCAIDAMTEKLNQKDQGARGMLTSVFKRKEFRMRVAPAN